MKKEHSVVMLPTQKAIIAPFGTNFITMLSLGTGKYIKDLTFTKYFDGMQVPNPQHLYFTSDEEIKENDWVYSSFSGDVFVFHGIETTKHADLFKIVATTDPELCYNWYGNVTPTANVPKIGLDFVEAYIREYNAGKPIEKVMLEYDEFCNIGIVKCIKSPHNNASNSDMSVYYPELKLRDNGTVIVSAAKEKLYTHAELIDACYRFLSFNNDRKYRSEKQTISDWFNRNYPL